MKTKKFDFNLPERLIAQEPASPRDSSKLMQISRKGRKIKHMIFRDILHELGKNDVLVINTTKVFPARLFGRKETETGAKIELLLLEKQNETTFTAIAKPLRRLEPGNKIIFSKNFFATITKKDSEQITVAFVTKSKSETILDEIHKHGKAPLPPYIKKELKNPEQYQTIFAKQEDSSAAPTAGFHFTADLIEKLKNKGVEFEEISLQIGLGTFKPVTADKIENHKMHLEKCEISKDTAKRLNAAKKQGKRIIAVGTTSVRTLETACDNGKIEPGKYETDIFIYPGKKFNFIDSIITNFHLPKSTLIMLVCAFMGTRKTMRTYKLAIKKNYRFFSFGDSMWIK